MFAFDLFLVVEGWFTQGQGLFGLFEELAFQTEEIVVVDLTVKESVLGDLRFFECFLLFF